MRYAFQLPSLLFSLWQVEGASGHAASFKTSESWNRLQQLLAQFTAARKNSTSKVGKDTPDTAQPTEVKSELVALFGAQVCCGRRAV